jgi:hypothetical protein
VLGDPPAHDHGDDRADGERPRASAGAAAHQHQHGGAAHDREDHQRQRIAREPVVDDARVGVQRDQAGRGERADRDGGRERAGGEVALQIGSPGAPRVADRNTDARYAEVATNSAPIDTDNGFSQLDTGSPAALPTGTLPAATAPTTVPTKNRVRCSRPLSRRPPRSVQTTSASRGMNLCSEG